MKKSSAQPQSIVIKGQNAIGMINASGRAQVKVDQKVIHQATPEMDRLFQRVNRELETRLAQADPKAEKVQEQAKRIEKEAARGEKADPAKLESWLVKLARMAPDILDVMLASLAGPVTGFTAVFKKIAERAKVSSTG
jgi:Skp family chaperone for outer membrane proteins